MTPVLSPEATKAASDAELQLLKLDAEEWLAVFHDQAEHDYLRSAFAEKYRTAVGVHPEKREEFRESLLRVRDGSGMPVADVIEALNRQ
ncbi:MAG: hypothetical protein IAG10_02785 [Planctomycetaceae bacterium]|nr:hypothetical protein [Planctomycetaceae bacterium]